MVTDNLVKEYILTRPGSQKLNERARKVFAADGATHFARILDPFRPYIVHAKGSRKWDVDGNEYIDYAMGHGALILGHCHPVIVRAVQEQAAKGVHYGDSHELEIEWAELILSMMPSLEQIEFFSCGQEANMMAIRLARLFTGRRRVMKFEDNFHGWADELATPAPGTVAGEVTVVPMHDLKRVEAELATGEYALIMVEGGGAHMSGQIPWNPDFVRQMPDLARKHSTVFLLDEVVTGFRDARGGWQSTIGIKPDLTSLGKTIGGGLGVGGLGGRAEIMDILKPKPLPQQSLSHSGTWNSNPLTASAGVAACKLYRDGKVQEQANRLGEYMRQTGNRTLKERGINGRLYGKSVVWFYLGPIDREPADTTQPPTGEVSKLRAGGAAKPRLCLHLLHRGIATMGARFFVLSAAHTEADIDRTVKALVDSLEAMKAEGSLK